MAKPVRLTLYVDNDQLKRALGESERSVENFGKKVQSQESPVKAATVAMGGFIAGLALGAVQRLEEIAVAAATYLPKLGEEFDNVSDRIRVSVGENPLLNGEINASFERLLPNVASNMEEVGGVLTTLYQRLGLTGPAAETLAKQILDLSRITGTDLGTNLEAITTSMNLWGISSENAAASIDFLFRASQQSGVPLGELASQVQNNGAQLQLLGLSFEDAVTAAAGLGEAGVSLDDLGTSFKKLISTAVKDGKPLSEVFDEYAEGIQDGSITMEQAIEDLGARSGTTFIALAKQGKLNFAEIRAQIDASTDTVMNAADATEDWPEKWQKTFNALQVALKPFSESVFDAMGDILDILVVKDGQGNVTGLNIAGAWDEVARKWESAWETIKPPLEAAWKQFVDWWKSDETQTTIVEIGTEVGKNIGKAIGDGLVAFIKSELPGMFVDSLKYVFAFEWAKGPIEGMIDNPSGSGRGPDPSDPTGQINNPGPRALGGNVWPGKPYIVGDAGRPELFVPDTAGRIIPRVPTGGGDTWNVTVNGVADPRLAVMELQRQRRKQVFLAGSR